MGGARGRARSSAPRHPRRSPRPGQRFAASMATARGFEGTWEGRGAYGRWEEEARAGLPLHRETRSSSASRPRNARAGLRENRSSSASEGRRYRTRPPREAAGEGGAPRR